VAPAVSLLLLCTGMALNAVMFPFARHQFGWDHRPFSVFLSYQSLLRLVGVGIVLPVLLRSGWVARVGGSRGVIAGALLCFVLATHGWQLFAIGGAFSSLKSVGCTNVVRIALEFTEKNLHCVPVPRFVSYHQCL
jgi:hypothetical protein